MSNRNRKAQGGRDMRGKQGPDARKGQRWNKPKTGNKQGKQSSVNNFSPYETGKGNKRDRQDEEIIDTVLKESKSNPLEYYTKYTRFAEDASKLPFAVPVGARFNMQLETVGTVTWAVPGVMRICFTPAIGVSRDFTSPINRSSTRFYTYLRANQKASAAYDHQDITMMELALDSCYMFHAMCSRIYETANAVTPLNEYYTRSLLAAQCVSQSDVTAHMQDFRGWINSFAYNLSQFTMPKGITLFDRHRWMCDNYYVDSPSSRAQTYIFVPRGFWKYDNTVTTGSQLTFVDYANPVTSGAKLQYTVAELMAMGNDLLNAIAGDEDFQFIAGDIYNFYGGDVYSVPYLEENSLLVPKYDETVLSQIENATIVGEFAATPTITQNPSVNAGAILFNPVLESGRVNFQGEVPMNFHWDSPTPGQIIEASRLIAVVPVGSGNTIESCGTELVNRIDIFQINPATGAVRTFSINNQVGGYIVDTPASVNSATATMLYIAQFDWAPSTWWLALSGTGEQTTYNFQGTTWDVDNFAMIPGSQIQYVHEACLWSLFEVGNNRADIEPDKA